MLGGLTMVILKNVYDPSKSAVKLTRADLEKTFEWYEKQKNLESKIFKNGVD